MTTAIGIYLLAVSVILAIYMLVQHHRGTWELFSIRNIAILGFIIFQLLSAGLALLLDRQGPQYIEHPVATGFMFAAMSTVFLLIALWVYERGFIATWLADRMPVMRSSPNDSMLIALSAFFIITAFVFKFLIANFVPIIGILADQLADAMSAAACGLVGWLWGRRFFNPMIIAIVCVIGISAMIVTMYGAFGRRGMVAVGGALIWGLYYSNLRLQTLPVIIRRIAVVAAPALILVAIYTAARGYVTDDRTIEGRIAAMQQQMAPAQIRETVVGMMVGQGAGPWSMWLIESYPDDFEHRHLESVYHFVTYPVPRALWPDKPSALGIEIPKMALIQDVDRDALNIGVGIIGSSAADGGWYALILYALLAGIFLRFFDQLVVNQATSPFVVVPVGAALGQTLALARGETSAFAALMVIGVFGTFITMIILHYFIVRLGLASAEDNDLEMDELLEDADDGPDGPPPDDPHFDPRFDPKPNGALASRFGPEPPGRSRFEEPAATPRVDDRTTDERTNGSVRPPSSPGGSPPA